MSRLYSLRAYILGAFLLLTLAVVLCMGAVGYVAGGSLAAYLVERQTAPVMETLIEAERQAVLAKDNDEEAPESGSLAATLGWKFLVGKEVPPEIRELAPGLHLYAAESRFILLKEVDGTFYALEGALGDYAALRRKMLRGLLLCGLLALLAALGLGVALSRILVQPLGRLTREVRAREIRDTDEPAPPFPAPLIKRRDEVGVLARALAGNQEKLRSYIQRESAFTGDVSHELRTPLTVMAGTLEILAARLERLPPQTRQELLPAARRLERTTAGMRDIVQTLLALARAPTALDNGEVDLEELLDQTVRTARNIEEIVEEAGKKSVCYRLEDGREIRLGVFAKVLTRGERQLMEIVVGNLLENALRYAAGPLVRVYLYEDCLKLENEGAIPSGNIFNRGVKGAASAGSGFGLSIASRACERLGWSLACRELEGSVSFEVRFNLIH